MGQIFTPDELKKDQWKNYVPWYANIPPSEIRKEIGNTIAYVTRIDKYRGYYDLEVRVIDDACRSFIIFDDGNNVDKRDIKDVIIKRGKN